MKAQHGSKKRSSSAIWLSLSAALLFSVHLAVADDNTENSGDAPTAAAPTAPTTPTAAAPANGAAPGANDPLNVNDCVDAYDTAKQACTNANSSAGMSQQAQAQAQSLSSQVAAANSQTAATAAQMAQQCKLQADVNAALGALSGLKGNACASSISDCQDTCNDVIKKYRAKDPTGTKQDFNDYIRRAKKNAGKCASLQQNSSAALQAAAALLGGLLQNLACDALSSVATPTPAPGCDDPTYAATNILCICTADPKNAMCTAQQQFPSGASVTTVAAGPVSPVLSADSSLASDGSPVDANAGKPTNERGTAAAEGGGGAGGLGGGNNNNKPNNDDNGNAPARSNVDKSVISGTMGGSGGGGGSGGAPAGAAAGGGGGGRGGGGQGTGAFDLSKFLPKAGGRGIANMSISAKDGMTGATGPSIWEKVSNQYQLQKPNLIQDR